MQVDLLHAVDLAGLDEAAELGDGLPLLLLVLAAAASTATATSTATVTTAGAEATATSSTISHVFVVEKKLLFFRTVGGGGERRWSWCVVFEGIALYNWQLFRWWGPHRPIDFLGLGEP